jgi:hypothetical protein
MHPTQQSPKLMWFARFLAFTLAVGALACPVAAAPCNPYQGCNPNTDPTWPVYLTGPGSSLDPSLLVPDRDKYRNYPRAIEQPLDEPSAAAFILDEPPVAGSYLEDEQRAADPVPEPGTWWLLACGAAGVLFRLRRE